MRGLGWVGKIRSNLSKSLLARRPNIVLYIGKSIGCQVYPTTLKHIRETCNNQRNEDYWHILMIEEGNLTIAVHCNKRQGCLIFLSCRLKGIVSSLIIQSLIISVLLCLFIAAISISCVVSASLSVPDWEDRSSPQSSQPPSLFHPWYPSQRTILQDAKKTL